ncbi:hypothetical protein T265_07962 [Opisthorchis viverrini]|uniref:Solute carrier family 66 member 2 n=1 Tax=Opisthorchis viverrini TaxID=6198 RepID=A0A074ZLW9_OPIVI|nr:hypothetical protein T265_07962 [Opisthorchis viverrini]KER24360.1 hypothetical protein T265_07962 [Opisthorchis viverrini]
MKELARYVYILFYIFGGIVPYVPQYMEIRRLHSIKGFSTYVCLTLLIANLLRVCFWFVHPFSTPLLVQSLVMIATMLVMMHLAANVLASYDREHLSVHKELPVGVNPTIWSSPVTCFWKWTDFTSYALFTALFMAVASGTTYLLSSSPVFVQLLGFVALFIEALLGLPQLLKNYRNKSTKGMSLMMVALWTVGDVGKSVFFMLEGAPFVFPLCGWFQVTLDCFIFGQYVYYN